MAYTAHKWISTDDDAECEICGLTESEAVPTDGPMISCHRTITAEHVPHATSTEVTAEVDAKYGVDGAGELSDGAALAIASWWQAPRGHGLAFAQFASTYSITYEALADAIHSEYADADTTAKRELDMLSTWALDRLITQHR